MRGNKSSFIEHSLSVLLRLLEGAKMIVHQSQKQKYCKHKMINKQCAICGYVVKKIKIFRPLKKELYDHTNS